MSSRVTGPKSQSVAPSRPVPEKAKASPAETTASKGWALSNNSQRREVTGRGVSLSGARPAPQEARLMRAGQSGDDVKTMQRQLGLAQTGTFDAPTLRAVKDFQAKHGLVVDGLVGPKTQAALAGAAKPQTPIAQKPVDTPSVQTPAIETKPSEPETTTTPAATSNTDVSSAALGDPAARLALARQIVKPMGSATQADVDAVVSEVAKMPLSEMQDLQKARINFVACRDSVADAYPYLEKEHPRGWPPGRRWKDVPGAYMPNEKSVVVATRDNPAGGREVFPSGDKHGSASLAMHEGGHAVDAARSYPSLNDKDFQSAYKADLAAGHLAEYYTQSGEAGPSEAFAESHAMFLTGDPTGEGARAFPKMMEYWANKYSVGAAS